MSLLAQQVAALTQSLAPVVPSGRIHRCEDDEDEVIYCTKCGEPKAYEDFYYNASKKERQYECKDCVRAAQKLRRDQGKSK